MTFQEGWLRRQLERASSEVSQWSEERKSLIPNQDENQVICQSGEEGEAEVRYK